MTSVVVVGGGILGACVAYRLTQEGAVVTLVEADRLASGASGASFAWLNADAKPPLDYHRLNVSGMAEHLALRHELGAAPWLHVTGRTAWARGARAQARLRERIAQQQGWGYPVEVLPISELRRLEPELVAPPEVATFAHYPTEGYVDVPLLIGALVARAEAEGATFRPGCRVERFLREGRRVVGAATARQEIKADCVVVCAGASAGEVAGMAGLRFPMASTVGMTAVTAPTGIQLRGIHTDDEISIRPDGAGRVMLRHERFDERVERATPVEPVPGVCYELRDLVARTLPAVAGARIEACRITTRPRPGDLYPAVGPAPDADGLYLVSTHSGVTLGPLLGRLVAQEVLHGERDPRLDPYRPERLIAPESGR